MIMMFMMFMRTQCKVSTKSNVAWHRAHLPCGSDPSHCWWSLFSSCDFMLMMIILTVAFLYIPQFTLPPCCWWSCHDQIIPQFTFKNRLQFWKRSCWGMMAMTTFAVRLVRLYWWCWFIRMMTTKTIIHIDTNLFFRKGILTVKSCYVHWAGNGTHSQKNAL